MVRDKQTVSSLDSVIFFNTAGAMALPQRSAIQKNEVAVGAKATLGRCRRYTKVIIQLLIEASTPTYKKANKPSGMSTENFERRLCGAVKSSRSPERCVCCNPTKSTDKAPAQPMARNSDAEEWACTQIVTISGQMTAPKHQEAFSRDKAEPRVAL